MTEQEAIHILQNIIQETAGKEVHLSISDDLRNSPALDSLDLVMFFIEYENRTGVKLPETDKLGEEGWHKIDKLIEGMLKS